MSSRDFLLVTESYVRQQNTNEICFYTYDHLLDIFLSIRVSREMNKLPRENRIFRRVARPTKWQRCEDVENLRQPTTEEDERALHGMNDLMSPEDEWNYVLVFSSRTNLSLTM